MTRFGNSQAISFRSGFSVATRDGDAISIYGRAALAGMFASAVGGPDGASRVGRVLAVPISFEDIGRGEMAILGEDTMVCLVPPPDTTQDLPAER
jgi:hypothetical protein